MSPRIVDNARTLIPAKPQILMNIGIAFVAIKRE